MAVEDGPLRDAAPPARREAAAPAWELRAPLLLTANRVPRFYRGGRLIDAFRGEPQPADSDRPEDWVGSVTRSWTPVGEPPTDEGLSRVEVDGSDVALHELLEREPEQMVGRRLLDRLAALRDPESAAGAPGGRESAPTTGLLVKLLDSVVRLPVHAHPSRPFAREVLGSAFGKTEAWLVLETRQIEGQEEPHVRVGLRRDVQRAELLGWVERQETDALLDAMERWPVAAGDAILVPAGTLHTIGAGVFLVELQEPTDFSIVAEWAGFPIDPRDAHLGLGWEVMIDALDRRRALVDQLRQAAQLVSDEPALREERLLGEAADPFFRASRLTVRAEAALPWEPGFMVGIVTAGRGEVHGATRALSVQRGSTFAVPAAAAPGLRIVPADGELTIMCCRGPDPDLL